MLLFGPVQFGGDGRGMRAALAEALAEIGDLRASLKAAQLARRFCTSASSC